MHEFKNKVVVVTGGNSGIGKSIAKKFAEEGAKVVLFGRNQKRLEETAAAIPGTIAVAGDVCHLPDITNLMQVAADLNGHIDIVIANAGIAENHNLQQMTKEQFDKVTQTNYQGLYFTVQYALPYMTRGGSVIHISSVASDMGIPHLGLYNSTKAAVTSLSRSFSIELIEKGLRVNTISPGAIDTPMFDKVEPQVIQEISSRIPAKRFGTPEEIADAALFLSSTKASYIVGADLVVDGGVMAAGAKLL